jgi:hypothetical protein
MLDNTSILFINDTQGLSAKLHGLQIDFVVVGKQTIRWLEEDVDSFTFKNIVLDGSLPSWEIADITNKLPAGVQIYAVDREGAFVLRI